jgi:hypothetical protein
MRFWKRRKTRKSLGAGFAGRRSDALAERVAGRIVRVQRQVAAWLERKTQYWNKASKLIALYLFCLLFGGFSLWLLIKAFF